MTYSTPVTIKFSDHTLNEITKAARKLSMGRSTLLREIVMRYLPDYLASTRTRQFDKDERRTMKTIESG